MRNGGNIYTGVAAALLLARIGASPASAGMLFVSDIHSVWRGSSVPRDVPGSTNLYLAVPRGGRVSGVVVYADETPPETLPRELAAWRHTKTGATLPESATQIRCARDGGKAGCVYFGNAFSAKQKVRPFWITVQVPRDAEPGQYRSTLKITNKVVNLRLEVEAFRLPPKAERLTMLSLMQSPDSVALHYGVAPYSDGHFEKLESSLRWQGVAGGNVLTVPVVGQDIYGTRTGMVQFSRQGETLVPRFEAFERYLELFVKHCGPPKAVIVHLFETGWFRKPKPDAKGRKPTPPQPVKLRLTERTEDGAFKPLMLDAYPAHEELWKATLDGLVARLEQHGVARDAVRLGEPMETEPPAEICDMFKRVAPDLGWAVWSYGRPATGWTNAAVTLMEVAGFPGVDVAAGAARGGWGDERPILAHPYTWYCRFGRGLRQDYSWRTGFDLAVVDRRREEAREQTPEGWRWAGLGKTGLDFWYVPIRDPKSRETKASLWHGSPTLWGDSFAPYYRRMNQCTPRALTTPGRDGAQPLAMLEILAEGVQEAELRCQVEKMLASGKVPRAYADFYDGLQRYEAMFDDHITDPAKQRLSGGNNLHARNYRRFLRLASAIQEYAEQQGR